MKFEEGKGVKRTKSKFKTQRKLASKTNNSILFLKERCRK